MLKTTTVDQGLIEVHPGEDFVVSAKGRPGAGYIWTLESHDGVNLVSDDIVPSRSFGGPAETTWRFRCDRPGDYALRFRYGRSFVTAESARAATVNVVSKPS